MENGMSCHSGCSFSLAMVEEWVCQINGESLRYRQRTVVRHRAEGLLPQLQISLSCAEGYTQNVPKVLKGENHE